MRLIALLLSFILLLILLVSSARHTEAMQAHEQAARRFAGWPLWVLTMPTVDEPRWAWQQARWHDSDWLAQRMLHPAAPATAMAVPSAPLARNLNERLDQYLPQWLVNAASGLPLWGENGLPACAWLGSTPDMTHRPGAEWQLGLKLRCQVVPPPDAWHALRYEVTGATLLIRVEHAPLMLGAAWLDAAGTVYAGHASDCAALRRESSLPLICSAPGASRSSAARATPGLGQLQGTSLLLGLAAAGLSLLVYVHGLSPGLARELALRAALGAPPLHRLAWLLSEASLQWLLVTGPPAALTLIACSIGGYRLPEQTSHGLLATWLASSGLVLLLAAGPALLRLPTAMAQLGKPW